MGNVSTIVKQMKKERDKVEKQLSGLNAALAAFVGAYYGNGGKPTRKHPEVVSKGKGEDRSGTTGTMGKGSGKESSLNIPPKQEARASSVPLLLNR